MSQYAYPSQEPLMTAVGNTLYFTATDGTHGVELWKTDGTAAGTVMVKDIQPGNAPYNGPIHLTAVGNNLFFAGFDGAHGYELWKTDGTADGTVMVKDIVPGLDGGLDLYAAELAAAGNTLYFTATDPAHGFELWKSDGTAAG